jgi:hypothetical protein
VIKEPDRFHTGDPGRGAGEPEQQRGDEGDLRPPRNGSGRAGVEP